MRPISEKLLSRQQVVAFCEAHRRTGKRIGFTSGAFDLLHAGHADFMARARNACDVLVVAINTDESVRRYKGPGRPIVPEQQRAELIAALESVDYVFLFSERRNAKNIELLKPDLYIKAGDYQKANLTSAEVVEKHGGKALLLEIKTQTSTTDLIRKACGSLGLTSAPATESNDQEAVSLASRPGKMSPAVFIDRDGTINEEVEYLHEPEKFTLLSGAAEGMRKFADMGYRIVIVTTQAGIGLGYFTKEDFYRVNRAMFRAVGPYGVKIDRIYFCPHSVTESCECRKPGSALFERAREDLNLDLAASVMIGDKTSDIEAGHRLGMATVLVTTGHAGKDGEYEAVPDHVAATIEDAALWMLNRERDKEA